MAIPKQEFKTESVEDTEWTLTPEQMLFMLQNHNAIEAAFEHDNLQFLRDFAASGEFQELFGEMSFDEAYDRYETSLADGIEE